VKSWEYSVEYSFSLQDVENNSSNLEHSLDEAGKEGWELCGRKGSYLIFKRELIEKVSTISDLNKERER